MRAIELTFRCSVHCNATCSSTAAMITPVAMKMPANLNAMKNAMRGKKSNSSCMETDARKGAGMIPVKPGRGQLPPFKASANT